MEPIENLDHDWSQIVDRQGKQVATVGHHWKLSRSFNRAELERMTRDGTCIACHSEIPDNSLAINLLHHVAEYSDQIPHTKTEHSALIHKLTLLSAWAQVGGTAAFAVIVGGLFWYRRRRHRNRQTANPN